jgi:hypothetical protein
MTYGRVAQTGRARLSGPTGEAAAGLFPRPSRARAAPEPTAEDEHRGRRIRAANLPRATRSGAWRQNFAKLPELLRREG